MCGAFLLGAGCVLAQDWPQWRGPQRDGKVSGFVAPREWPGALAQKWKRTVGWGDATPALVNGRLFVFARQGGEEVIVCLNAGDGTLLWEDRYAAQAVTGPAASYRGPRSSPAVAEGKVLTLGVGGILSCLDARTGQKLWRQDPLAGLVPRFFTAMSPMLVNGTCVVHLGGTDQGAVMALDLATGKEKWKWSGEGPAYASPVLMTVGATTQVVIQTEKNLMGLALADGRLLWRVPTPPQSGYWNSVTPVVDGTTVIYTGQGKGSKAVRIVSRGEGFAAEELWSNEKVGTVYNTPVLKDGRIFGLSDRGHFFCLDAQTGRTAWTATNRVSYFTSILDVGPVLLALPEKSGLIAFRASDQRYEELARIKLSDTPTYAHPVVAGRRVWVKDSETVTLWVID
jgi:outer membrane protein assembly factor BamB